MRRWIPGMLKASYRPYRALDASGAVIGYAVTVQVKGYGGDMEVRAALSPDASQFIGLRVGRNSETMGYGSRVTEEAFYRQFTALAAPASVGGYTGIDEPGDTSAPPAKRCGPTVSTGCRSRNMTMPATALLWS